jgi:hypothetical protein
MQRACRVQAGVYHHALGPFLAGPVEAVGRMRPRRARTDASVR